jgi:excisionase family DNA binding protein
VSVRCEALQVNALYGSVAQQSACLFCGGRHVSELLTIDELSAYLRVPVATLRKWRANGTGPACAKVGRHLRYRRNEIDRWVAAQEHENRPPAA